MTRYAVRARQLMPDDDAWLVCDAHDWTWIEGCRPTRELAEALRDRLERWYAQKARVMLDDEAPVWADPGNLAAILEKTPRIEPSVQRVRELERQRLVLAQGMAA